MGAASGRGRGQERGGTRRPRDRARDREAGSEPQRELATISARTSPPAASPNCRRALPHSLASELIREGARTDMRGVGLKLGHLCIGLVQGDDSGCVSHLKRSCAMVVHIAFSGALRARLSLEEELRHGRAHGVLDAEEPGLDGAGADDRRRERHLLLVGRVEADRLVHLHRARVRECERVTCARRIGAEMQIGDVSSVCCLLYTSDAADDTPC
eukprot:676540-Pleurochrysis_carterae.AAC.1